MWFQYTNIISLDGDTGAHFSSLFFLCVCVFYFNLSAGGGVGGNPRSFQTQEDGHPLLQPCNLRRTRIKALLGEKVSF